MSRLEAFRRRRDNLFRTSEHSPLEPEQRERFKGLDYFEERPDLRFVVTLDRDVSSEPLHLQTTTGEPREFIRAGKMHVEIENQPVTFVIYREVGRGRLFLPFRDGTSGKESYPAGRYLDPQETPSGEVVVDFNYAYNPYCAYNAQWSCPFPPQENVTDVPIRAGERQFSLD